MLKDRIIYEAGLPVNVIISKIQEIPIHFHEDLEILLVLSGAVTLKNGFYVENLKEGDLFILNARELHSYYRNAEENIVLILQINLDYFSRYFDHLRNSFFVAEPNDSYDEGLDLLRRLMAQIARESITRNSGYQRRMVEGVTSLLSCLFEEFQYFALEEGHFVNETRNKGNKVLAGRLSRITDYLYEHYEERLTLEELSRQEHLSVFYLSHLIKAATGLSFQELLSFIRVEESEKLLLGTEKRIGTIAEDCGFSAVRYYIKAFERWFGLHPEEYRHRYAGQVMGRQMPDREQQVDPQAAWAAMDRLVGSAHPPSGSTRETRRIELEVDWDDLERIALALEPRPDMTQVRSLGRLPLQPYFHDPGIELILVCKSIPSQGSNTAS